MGMCLYFETDEPVDAESAEEILADAALRCSLQPWLFCEPLLPRIEEDGRMTGWSKLNLQPWPEELENADGHSPHDLQALLDSVVRWSRAYELTWIVSIEGESLGRIERGNCDQGIRDTILGMIELSGSSAPSDSVPARADAAQLRLFDPEQN